MPEQTNTERRSPLSSWLVWAGAGVVIGLALFAITLRFTRAPQTNGTPPAASSPNATVATLVDATVTPATVVTSPTLVTYTVQSGDVLGAIAERFGVRASAIVQANADTLTNPDRLQVGQVLRIPVSASQTPLAQATALPTPTPLPPGSMQKHTIAKGEVLSTIAEKYGVSIEALRTANNLRDDTIRAGDTLIIPIPAKANEPTEPTPTAAPSNPTQSRLYAFSIQEGDLAQAYPLSESGSNFSVHYQPNTPAAQEIQAIVAFLEQAQQSIVKSLGVRFTGRFDVYLASTLFAPPNQALRGRSFSNKRITFVLYDGSGSADERRYMLAHELTHLIAWNTYGPAKSAMLSEGAAVFAGEPYLLAGEFLPIQNFCLAYRRTDVLPLVASPNLSFQGHLLSLDAYYASGCFVQYLIKTYGTAKFGKLYSSLDYHRIYSRSLTQLQNNWLASLDANKTRLPFVEKELPNAYEALLKDYGAFFTRAGNGDVDADAYHDLDQRRLNVLMGKV